MALRPAPPHPRRGHAQRLRTHGAVTPSTLCELTGHTAGAVTGMIDRLVAAGFAQRTRDRTDGRRVVVKPDRRAIRGHLGPLQRTLDAAFDEIGGEFSAAELKLVARYLERSVEVLDGVVGEVSGGCGTANMDRLISALENISTPRCLEAARRLQAADTNAESFDLHLRSAGLNARHASVLADAIHQLAAGLGPRLRSFSASYNPQLTDRGVVALAEAFPATMTEVGLVACALGDTAGIAISKWAQRALRPRLICVEENRFSVDVRRRLSMLKNQHTQSMVVV